MLVADSASIQLTYFSFSVDTSSLLLFLCRQFRYLAVLDFEATCIRDGRINPQEVIEFPLVLLDTRTGQTVGEFHRYCRYSSSFDLWGWGR